MPSLINNRNNLEAEMRSWLFNFIRKGNDEELHGCLIAYKKEVLLRIGHRLRDNIRRTDMYIMCIA